MIRSAIYALPIESAEEVNDDSGSPGEIRGYYVVEIAESEGARNFRASAGLLTNNCSIMSSPKPMAFRRVTTLASR